MRKSLLGSLQSKARRVPDLQPSIPPAWPLYDEHYSKPQMNPQRDSPLFTRLSAELRVLIYQAALTDPHRFLHICKNNYKYLETKKEKVMRRLTAHVWCTDMESTAPTWQHACYGDYVIIEPGKYTAFVQHRIMETNDKLLSLLLACRLM